IIRKRDGGFNYATTDIATIDYRVNDLKADAIWYVVGAPQTLHFKQIFEIGRREGYRADLCHIVFGNVLGGERKLMKTRSGEIVPQVLNGFRPNILANYLFELANSFHTFYEACPVLKSEEPARSSRLALCDLTARVLQRGLDLLGIKVPERM